MKPKKILDFISSWHPYQHIGFFDRIRYCLLPAPLAKKRYLFPIINRVGVSLVEFPILIACIAATVVLCVTGMGMGSEASGSWADLVWIPLMLTIFYRNIITLLLGISAERSMMWHGLFALIATAVGIWHGYIAIFIDKENGGGSGWKASFQGGGENQNEFWTGAFASGFMALTVITSFYPIRKFLRRIWLWSHHIFPLAAVVAALLHGSATPAIMTALFVVDRLFGYVFQAHWQYRRSRTESVSSIANGLVKISFPRTSLFYYPGQYMSICVPSVSWFEWHTFTIASSPRDDQVVFLIKPDGYWTRRLFKKTQMRSLNHNESTELPIFVHGPLGSIALDWMNPNKYKNFILVGGGIGVTPLISFFRHLGVLSREGRKFDKVLLVYTTRSIEDAVSVLKIEEPSLDSAENQENLYPEEFELHVYVTRGKKAPKLGEGLSKNLYSSVRWHYERPDLPEIFRETANLARSAGSHRVGVLTCGPSKLTRSVIKYAGKNSLSNISFDLHVEHFT